MVVGMTRDVHAKFGDYCFFTLSILVCPPTGGERNHGAHLYRQYSDVTYSDVVRQLVFLTSVLTGRGSVANNAAELRSSFKQAYLAWQLRFEYIYFVLKTFIYPAFNELVEWMRMLKQDRFTSNHGKSAK